jgi:enoyl-[acyl-carrier-protein] reductase (NADH)
LVPGGIQTELLHNYWRRLAGEQGVSWQQIRDHSASAVALERVATTAEVTAAALFLAADDSSAITGQSINVDCGGVLVG